MGDTTEARIETVERVATEATSGVTGRVLFVAVLACGVHEFACSPDAAYMRLCPACAQERRAVSYAQQKVNRYTFLTTGK